MGIIFISHSSKNNDEAVRVRDWLRAEGYAETFLDLDPEQGFAPGQRWQDELRKAGERCAAIVFLISPDWVASQWCQTEFLVASQLGKRMFPLMIAPTAFESLRIELAQFQIADASTPEKREDGFNRLRIGIKRAGLDPKHFTWPPTDEPDRAPYRGLRALEEQDAGVFFGRDAQITKGLDELRRMRDGVPQHILAIAAASGAGKSSFLKAGLLSRLKRDTENFLVLPTVRPGNDALSGESGVLAALSIAERPDSPEALHEQLSSLQAPIIAHLKNLASAAKETYVRPPPALVLPIDQAEELFSADNTTGRDALALIAQCLVAKSDFLTLLTIRSDSLGHLQADAKIADQLNLFNLPALPPQAFKDVIKGPARLARPPIEIEDALTERLISELNHADALPLLAFTLECLVEGYAADQPLELQEYTEGLGGVAGAINAAVEAAFRRIEQDPAIPDRSRFSLRKLARAAFIPSLVQLTEADASPKRRVARLGLLPESTHPLIRHFVDERLLVSSVQNGETIIEVSHEAVLRHWRELAGWIGEERVVLEELNRIQRSAAEWGGSKKALSAHAPDLLVHGGERLKAAEAYLEREDLARELVGAPTTYLKACREREDNAAAEAAAAVAREEQLAAEVAATKEAQEQERQAQLVEREKALKRQRRLQTFVGAVTAMAFGIVLLGGWLVANGQRNLERANRVPLIDAAERALESEQSARSLRLAALAVQAGWAAPIIEEAETSFDRAARQTINAVVTLGNGPDVARAELFAEETRVLTMSDDGIASIWDVASGSELVRLEHEGWPDDEARFLVYVSNLVRSSAVLFADETRVLTWSVDNTARIWDVASGTELAHFEHENFVRGAKLFDGETRLLTWSDDGRARIWDVANGVELARFQHEGSVYGAELFAGETRLLTYSDDGSARIWDVVSGVELARFQHEGSVYGAELFAGETRLLTWSGGDGSARIWDVVSGVELARFQHEGYVNSAELFAGETRLLTWSGDGSARIWDVVSGVELARFQHEGYVNSAELFAGETRLLTWSGDGSARFWDVASGVELARLEHEYEVHAAKLFADETRLLTYSDDGSARILDVASGVELARFQHEGSVYGAELFAGETRLLTWSSDGSARIWDVVSERELVRLVHGSNPVIGARFFVGETRVLTWSSFGSARIWEAGRFLEIESLALNASNVCHERLAARNLNIITEDDVAFAPILASRLGEDVCDFSEPLWYPITRSIIRWLPDRRK